MSPKQSTGRVERGFNLDDCLELVLPETRWSGVVRPIAELFEGFTFLPRLSHSLPMDTG